MQLLKKLIILSGYHNSGKGIIKIESFNGKSTAEVRIFEPKKNNYRLGVRIGLGRLLEYDLDSKVSSIQLEYTNLEERIDCVIVESETLNPLLYGSTIGSNIDIARTIEMFTEDNPHQEKPRDNVLSEDISEDNECVDAIDSKVYTVEEEIKDIDKEKVQEYKEQLEQDFFIEIKPQLDELFKCYPADKELMLSVPDSKWVRVNYEKDQYYVVGVLFNGKRATHICYGVPGYYNVRPKQKSEWLPLDYLDPEGKGYWVIFQDAITGKTLE